MEELRPAMKALLLIPILAWLPTPAFAGPAAMRDPGFEDLPLGRLAPTGAKEAWQIQTTGRDVILPRLVVACVNNQPHSGKKCLSLSIPEDTVGFEFVTVGQSLRLQETKTYEASVWVRWPEGPDKPPAGASATSGHRSAIVSFWVRHRDSQGDFAGRDEWLFDNQWHQLTFRFRATDPNHPSLVYVSLLPNQKPAATTILIDDFELDGKSEIDEQDSRTDEIVTDAKFADQSPGKLIAPWSFSNIGGTGISGKVVADGDSSFVTLAMDKATSNFESAQVWQHIDLRKGTRYELACRMRWDNFSPDAPAPIVNYGIYHEETRTWYGPVDQILQKTADWRSYRFIHVPPYSGKWKLYVQMNGWGNFGNGVDISIDELSCRTVSASGP